MTTELFWWGEHEVVHLYMPYACFPCRKSFKRYVADASAPDVLPCPECRGSAVRLSRKFKPPRRSDKAQWAKVEAVFRAGFRFESLPGYAPYPRTLAEVDEFVRRHGGQPKKRR